MSEGVSAALHCVILCQACGGKQCEALRRVNPMLTVGEITAITCPDPIGRGPRDRGGGADLEGAIRARARASALVAAL